VSEQNFLDDLASADKVRNIEPPKEKRGFFSREKKETKPRRVVEGRTDAALKKAIRDFFKETAPALIVFAGDEYDAKVVQVNADRLAESYVELAKASPRFRALLNAALSAGGPMMGAIFATAAVAIPILHHHKLISLPPIVGIPLIGETLEIHEEKTEDGKPTSDATESARTAASAVA